MDPLMAIVARERDSEKTPPEEKAAFAEVFAAGRALTKEAAQVPEHK
jgi:hypothetical protein